MPSGRWMPSSGDEPPDPRYLGVFGVQEATPKSCVTSDEPGRFSFPASSLGELLGGFEAGQRSRRNRDELDLFRESPRIRLVSIGEATAERYAVIYASLRAKGQPIATNDLWIAASAMEHGTELVTLDRDFAHVAQILVALYEP